MDRNANAARAVKDGDDDLVPPARRPAHYEREPGERRAPLPSPGTCVAKKYIICDVLGSGGSAIVYAAEQVGLKRVVAFKLYPASGDLASSLLQRFEREAELLARVHHENVVAVYDAGSMPDGSPYLVVQRLQGDSLATRLLAGPLAVMEAVDLTHQALKALSALGDAGITHRDIKPGNIVLDQQAAGRTVLKLVDFGIAKEAHDDASPMLDAMVGTPRYMAPEQVRGERIDARCDLYALGATLYQMLTGHTPHTGDTVEEIARATLFAPITPIRELRVDCPAGLAQIVMRALARDPSHRFASAREMKGALERWQVDFDPRARLSAAPEHDPLEDTLRICTPQSASLRARRKLSKRTLGAAFAVAALGILVLSGKGPISPQSGEPSGQVAAQALHTSELAAFDLAPQASDRVSALLSQTSAVTARLLAHARTSAHELRQAMTRYAPGWRIGTGASTRDR